MKNIVLFALGMFATSMVGIACTDLTGPKSPETPVDVTATLLAGGTSVRLDWQASPQSDGVVSYNVIRNGTKIGEVTGTTFTDTGLAEAATYEYSVSANCTSGELSEPSPVTAASTVTTLDLTPPRVINNQPPNNFNGVSPGATATATFSEPMDPATLNPTTFTLRVTATGAAIPGTVTYNPTTRLAEFKPASNMPSSANITATVTTGAKDVRGNGLTADFTWVFTIADVAPPTVVATTPANGAVGVSATAPSISVTFSEPLNQATVNSSTITLQVTSTGQLVPGTVAYIAATRTATFTPASTLGQSTNYTVTATTGVKDVAGNALAAPFQFAFTTGDTNAPFVSATTPANLTTGVPTSTTVTATFSEPMDPNTISTTTFTVRAGGVNGTLVPGTVGYNVATATATFTPSSALASSTAYVATVTAGAKDISGNALGAGPVPNPWTFTTADNAAPSVLAVLPANGATGVPTSTGVTLTFSEPLDATTVNGTTITLKNTATNAAVAGTVGYTAGTTVVTFTPGSALAPGTGYTVTVTTGVKDVAGNAMAAQFTSTFTTVDNVAPTVSSVAPANGATGVPTNTVVNITFSEAMDASTINGTNITLKNTNTSAAVAGVVTPVSATVARFTPNANLSAGTGYTVTVTTGVKDVAGNAMAAQFTSAFTTAAAPDNTAPTVVSVSPANSSNAPASTKVYVTFSEPMDPTTITGTTNVTLKVTATSAAVPGTVSYNAGMNMAIFTPTSALTASTGYTVTVTTGVEDAAGNAMAAQFSSTFSTTAGADAAAPTVTAVAPAAGATGVSVNSAVTVTFSEGMDPTTINGTTFTVKVTSSSAAVAGTISYNSTTNVATFTPTSSLTAGTGYTVTVTTGVKDLAQNAMAAQFTSTFTTAP